MRAKILPAAAAIGVAAFVIATASSGPASARPADPSSAQTGGHHGAAQPANPCGTMPGGAGSYVSSQKYPPASGLTDTGAADFTVGAGGCLIQGVNVTGNYTGPSMATKVNILIKGGVAQPAGPDLAPASDKNITTFGTNSFGSFKVTLPSAVTLAPGHYWLTFQVKMPAGSTWSWETSPSTSGMPDVWRNPAGGWGCGTSWMTITTFCMAVPNADFNFQLI